METIRQLGTFDIENYGDLLYPLVFRRALDGRDPRLRLEAYAPLAGEAPLGAGFETRAARTLFEPRHPDPENRGAGGGPLVVGGGDILRTDRDTLGAHYGPGLGGRPGGLRSAVGSAGALRFHALRRLAAWRAERFRARAFARRWMGYKAPGPFLIAPEHLSGGGAVCYLSCGVPHEFAPDEREEVARVFERARFVYLRDEQSAEKLRRCGVRRELHVAPDLVVLLGSQRGREAEAAKGRALLKSFGVDVARPVLCFQSKPYPGFDPDEIAHHLARFREDSGGEVLLLPLGLCHGDAEFLRQVKHASGGAFKYADVRTVADAVSAIAASDLFVGTSLHGNITAFAFGRPHLCGPLPADKVEGFLRSSGLPLTLRLESWGELCEKVEAARSLGADFFAARAADARAKVARVVDKLLDALLA